MKVKGKIRIINDEVYLTISAAAETNDLYVAGHGVILQVEEADKPDIVDKVVATTNRKVDLHRLSPGFVKKAKRDNITDALLEMEDGKVKVTNSGFIPLYRPKGIFTRDEMQRELILAFEAGSIGEVDVHDYVTKAIDAC